MWQVARNDLHDGMMSLVDIYANDSMTQFSSERITHIVLLIICLAFVLGFLVVMFRPFLKHISKEPRRVAELLAQLPQDMDVEGLVEASWKHVLQVGETAKLLAVGCYAIVLQMLVMSDSIWCSCSVFALSGTECVPMSQLHAPKAQVHT